MLLGNRIRLWFVKHAICGCSGKWWLASFTGAMVGWIVARPEVLSLNHPRDVITYFSLKIADEIPGAPITNLVSSNNWKTRFCETTILKPIVQVQDLGCLSKRCLMNCWKRHNKKNIGWYITTIWMVLIYWHNISILSKFWYLFFLLLTEKWMLLPALGIKILDADTCLKDLLICCECHSGSCIGNACGVPCYFCGTLH